MSALRWEPLARSLWGADTGLLALSPWLGLALPGLAALWRARRRAEAATLAGIATLYLLFLASITFWRGGWQVGPRYVVVMLPMLLPAVALASEAWARQRLGAIAVAALILVGVVVFAGTSAQFPYFPERFVNPVRDVTLAPWRDGLAAPNPLRWLGVPGPWSLLPFAAAVAVPTLHACRAVARSWWDVAAASALALILVVWGLAALARPDPGHEQALEWIRDAMQDGGLR
jgi:hypothetical protein